MPVKRWPRHLEEHRRSVEEAVMAAVGAYESGRTGELATAELRMSATIGEAQQLKDALVRLKEATRSLAAARAPHMTEPLAKLIERLLPVVDLDSEIRLAQDWLAFLLKQQARLLSPLHRTRSRTREHVTGRRPRGRR